LLQRIATYEQALFSSNTLTDQGQTTACFLILQQFRHCIQALSSMEEGYCCSEREYVQQLVHTYSLNNVTVFPCRLVCSYFLNPCGILVHLCFKLRSHLILFHSHHVDNSPLLVTTFYQRKDVGMK